MKAALELEKRSAKAQYKVVKVVFEDMICHFKLFPQDTFETLRGICASYWHYKISAPEILFMDGKFRIYPWNVSVIETQMLSEDDDARKVKLVTMADVEAEQTRKWKSLRGACEFFFGVSYPAPFHCLRVLCFPR